MGRGWLLLCYFLHAGQTMLAGGNTTDKNILEKWEEIENNLQVTVDSLLARLQPIFDKYFSLDNVSSECREALNVVLTGVRKLQTWALKFIDSSGRPMPNVMSGSFSAPGLFDECIGIIVPEELSLQYGKKRNLSFRGQYCSINFRPPLPPKPKTFRFSKILPEFAVFENSDQLVEWGGYKYAQVFYFFALRFGVCFPSTCSKEDIKKIVEIVAENTIPLTAEINHCEVEEYNVWTKEQVIAISILAVPVTLSIIGTCVNIYRRVMNIQFICIGGKPRKTFTLVLDAFSVYTNMKKVVNTENKNERLSALHGIRALSLSWVVLCHTYAFADIQQIRNLKILPEKAGEVMIQIILNGTVAVDTFFLISGLLVVYVPLEKLTETKRKTISIPYFIFHRVWRLWPPLLTTILLTYFVPWTGSGPSWHERIDPIVDNCNSNWWAIMIFANNYIPVEQSCLPHTWYVCTDFQLYLFAIISLVILLRQPALAFVLNAVVSVIGMAVTGYLHWNNEFPPVILFDRADDRNEMMRQAYFPPYVHIGVYCVGMAVGYFLHKRKQITIKPIVKFIAWTAVTTCNLAILFASAEWNRGNHSEVSTGIAYAVLHRTVWAMCMAWIIAVCCTRNCEILRKFLSWGAFIPFSRLTFFAYLLHYLVANVVSGINRQSIHGDHLYAVSVFFTNLTVTYLLSFAATLFFESPLLAMEKILFSRTIMRSSENHDGHELSRIEREDLNDERMQPSTVVSRF